MDGETLGGVRGTGGYMTQHIDLSLVGRVRGREVRRKRKRRMVYKESGGRDGIKYTLSVKSTLFWDFSMHTVLLKDCTFSRVAARHQEDSG